MTMLSEMAKPVQNAAYGEMDEGVASVAAPTRVLLVDDHPLLRDGIRLCLQANPAVQVVGEAGGVDAALSLLPACHPQVVVTDIRMPARSGIDLVTELAVCAPHVRVLLLSMLDDSRLIARALAAGAAGYVRKDSPATVLLAAVQTVARGASYVDAAMAARLPDRQAGMRAPTPLTPRESAVMRLIAQGLGSREIAEALAMSVRTVETHRLRVRRKLHLETDVGLAGYIQRCPELALPH